MGQMKFSCYITNLKFLNKKNYRVAIITIPFQICASIVTMIHNYIFTKFVCHIIVEVESGMHAIKIHAKLLSYILLASNFVCDLVFYTCLGSVHEISVFAHSKGNMKNKAAYITLNPLHLNSTIPVFRSNCMCHIIMYLCLQG